MATSARGRARSCSRLRTSRRVRGHRHPTQERDDRIHALPAPEQTAAERDLRRQPRWKRRAESLAFSHRPRGRPGPWSPDGKWIVFDRCPPVASCSVWLVRADGSDQHRLSADCPPKAQSPLACVDDGQPLLRARQRARGLPTRAQATSELINRTLRRRASPTERQARHHAAPGDRLPRPICKHRASRRTESRSWSSE